MSRDFRYPPLGDYNAWADFWRDQIGVNVIPADTSDKKPIVSWLEWQDKPIPRKLHDEWKLDNIFSK